MCGDAKDKSPCEGVKRPRPRSDYAEAVARVPPPGYLIEFGELLQSLGRTAEAQDQFPTLAVESMLFQSNGVARRGADAVGADHGDPAGALHADETGIAKRPFLEMDDAYAGALHVNGAMSRRWSDRTRRLALGIRSALFQYHAGMIRFALGDAGATRGELSAAPATNPHFSPLAVPLARALDPLTATP